MLKLASAASKRIVAGMKKFHEERGPDKEVPVCSLRRGARFRSFISERLTITGTFVEATACSAKVILDVVGKAKTFTDAKGKQVTLGGARRKVDYWWPGACVEPTGEIVEVTETTFESNFEGVTNDMATLPGIGGKKSDKKVAGSVKSKKEKAAAVADHPCLCGCGVKVKGRFKMGHDGKYYSFLRRFSRGEIALGDMPKAIQAQAGTKQKAAALLKASGH